MKIKYEHIFLLCKKLNQSKNDENDVKNNENDDNINNEFVFKSLKQLNIVFFSL